MAELPNDAFQIRSIDRLIATLQGGDLAHDANSKLARLLEELAGAIANGAKSATGSLTIKLSFAADKSGVVKVSGDVNSKEPPPDKAEQPFWLTEDNRLSAVNPQQGRLFEGVEGGRSRARQQ